MVFWVIILYCTLFDFFQMNLQELQSEFVHKQIDNEKLLLPDFSQIETYLKEIPLYY